MTTDYLASIRKFISGAQHTNSNVKTQDGQYAYITNTGIARLYADETVFNATAGFNNCPSGFTEMDSTWDTLGFPIGSKMAVGEACGKEGSYVAADAPENDFDAKFYVKQYDISGIQTDSDALQHWNAQGKMKGYLPNASILDSMSALGKVGYVDLNTTLHAVSNPQFGGEYRQYRQHSNVAGTKMVDCLTPEPVVKYGDQLHIGFDGAFGSINNGFYFGSNKNALFIRPPLNSSVINNTPVKYGDSIVLAGSISDNANTCGYNGCQVGFVNLFNFNLEFGPGGATGGTALHVLPKEGGAQVVGDPVKLGDLFCLSAALILTSTASFKQGQNLQSGNSIKSTNGNYVLVYQDDGNLVVYATETSDVIWQSNASIPHTPGRLTLNSRGRLVEFDNLGRPRWVSPYFRSYGPFSLGVGNNGQLSIFDRSKKVMWSTPADPAYVPSDNEEVWFAGVKSNRLNFTVEPTNAVFSFQPLIASTAVKVCDLAQLKQTCNAKPDCAGFVHSTDNNTWQMIDAGSHFGIAPTAQDFYLKPISVPPTAGCTSAPPIYIKPNAYMAYGVGNTFSAESCSKNSVNSLLNQQRILAQQTQDKLKQLPQKQGSLSALNTQMGSNQNSTAVSVIDYQDTLKQLRQIQDVEGFNTMEQQQIDAEILQKQNQLKAMFWTASAFVVLLSVALIKSKQ
jgi:hypothetical protein